MSSRSWTSYHSHSIDFSSQTADQSGFHLPLQGSSQALCQSEDFSNVIFFSSSTKLYFFWSSHKTKQHAISSKTNKVWRDKRANYVSKFIKLTLVILTIRSFTYVSYTCYDWNNELLVTWWSRSQLIIKIRSFCGSDQNFLVWINYRNRHLVAAVHFFLLLWKIYYEMCLVY